jgi:hypothetical protein
MGVSMQPGPLFGPVTLGQKRTTVSTRLVVVFRARIMLSSSCIHQPHAMGFARVTFRPVVASVSVTLAGQTQLVHRPPVVVEEEFRARFPQNERRSESVQLRAATVQAKRQTRRETTRIFREEGNFRAHTKPGGPGNKGGEVKFLSREAVFGEILAPYIFSIFFRTC